MTRSATRGLLLLAAALLLTACGPRRPEGSLPPRGGATSPAIEARDLRHRVELFAHDSMEGRLSGTPGHDRATGYLAAEAARLRLEPAGENGSFFQDVPLHRRWVDRSIGLGSGGRRLALFRDYTPYDLRTPTRSVRGAEIVFGGTVGVDADRLTPEDASGRFVVLLAGATGAALEGASLASSAGVGLVLPDEVFTEYTEYLWRATAETEPVPDAAPQPVVVFMTRAGARALLGADVEAMEAGTRGGTIEGDIVFREELRTSRNVVAVLRGTDERLRQEYVALGAHSDHDGVFYEALPHDSLRRALWQSVQGTAPPSVRTGGEAADSIFNGADDDASGSMALLEIAEWLVDPAVRPRRSVLFVWHTAEEQGMVGSRWFTDHPTVPLDRIVAQVNIDMIGRGGAADIDGGGPRYLQVLGWRRLSTELGDEVERVNDARAAPFSFDEQFDAPGHPENYYCRSDHWMYARFGIPVAFFSTGNHPDYHELTDEPGYLDYEHYQEVTRFLGDVTRAVAGMERRPVVDGVIPDPNAPCRQ